MSLPTTVGLFCDFLDGKSVAPYGDRGITVIDTLWQTIQNAIYNELFARILFRVDELGFLKYKVLPILAFVLHSEMHSVLAPINVDVVLAVCEKWAKSFCAYLPQLSSKKSSMLSNSQVLSLVKSLLQDCDKEKDPTQIEEFRLIEISQELLFCMC